MANWSQSHFLQSLGWATLNSFWQMAMLWCIYLCATSLFRLSSHKKYQLSVLALASGFAWFVITFIYFYQSSPVTTLAIFNQMGGGSSGLMNVLLIAASIAYLSLLVFPSYKLFRNWQFVQRIKKHGLHKADLAYRLFVQRISDQLGLHHKVKVFVSDLVRSPLTVGYIKPIILLPVAALNNLSTQQVEAILLHELSHIRRYDYLVNLVISVINTVLYFNPFVKQFMKTIEEERENCCDELVLQFGYDKVGYASALLTLEKLSIHHQLLAMGATGKKHLLNRIEKIVGMEKKKGFRLNHLAGILAALFCIILFNSILIIKEKEQAESLIAFESVNPLNVFDQGSSSRSAYQFSPVQESIDQAAPASMSHTASLISTKTWTPTVVVDDISLSHPESNPMIMQVALNEVEVSLTTEQKENVKTTVDATRKILGNLQWKEMEKAIAEVLSDREKEVAKKEYLQELEKSVNWKNVEDKIKANYEEMDWSRINSNVKQALTVIQLDSLQKCYTAVLTQLEKANEQACNKTQLNSITPLPDQSVSEIQRSTEELRRKVDTIRALRNPKKVVKL
jgi:bla regulator protein BlaR1